MKRHWLLGVLPLVACQAVLGLEDTSVEPADASVAGEGGVVAGEGGIGSGADNALTGGAGVRTEGNDSSVGEGGSREHAGEAGRLSQGGAGGEAGTVIDGSATDWPTHSNERIFKVRHPWPFDWLTACGKIEASDVGAAKAFWLHVQALIADNWLRAADLALIFSEDCLEQHVHSFRFNITDGEGFETGLGYPGGVEMLDITLGVESSDAQVLYAFGRALGFEHEYGRDPYAGSCAACEHHRDCKQPGRTTCLDTGYCGNPAEHESIMAAPDCGGIDAGRRLTPSDVLGAQRAYGRKPAGSLLGARNLCWNAEYGIPAANLRITAWPCLRADNELWARVGVEEDDTLQATIAGQPFCAAASGSGAIRPFLTQSCSPADASKRFQFRGVKLLTMGGLCVAAKAAETGAELWTADCDTWSPSDVADWDLLGNRIRLTGSDLCITARDGAATYGQVLDLEPCDAASQRQRLSLQQGEIRYADNAGRVACFNVAGGTGVPGEAITLWGGCNFGFENLKFMARGRIEAGGRCAALLGDPVMTTPIGTSTCDGSTSQIWDYYW